MDRLSGLTLLLLAASPALATAPADSPGQLRLLEELRFDVQKNGTRVGADLQLVSASRFLKLGMEWERDAQKRLLRPRFKLLDLTTRRAVEVVVPLDAFPAGHRELLGPAPPPELVHHDGETTTMVFKQSKDSRPVAAWLCQYDHRQGRFSGLVKVADLGGARYLQPIGFDPPERYFYFAVEIYPPGDAPKTGPVTLELSRVALRGLARDWEMTLELPRRQRPLGLRERHFSPDGTRLALVEHNERSYPAATPPQRVYVIDLAARRVDTYPAPFTAYGVTFSRDARYLLLGSNDVGELSRIDLASGKIDRRLRGHRLVQRFVLSPSGRSFLLFSNTILASPKVVEVRRVEDLGLQTSVPIRLLFPGLDGTHPSLVSTADGRLLVASICEPSGFPSGTGVRIFEVPDDVESPAPAGTGPEELRIAQAVVLARTHADAARIELSLDPADEARTPRPTFTPITHAAGGSGDVLYVGTRSGNSDGDYRPGRTIPVVVRLDAAGRRRWEVRLPKPGFLDHTGARIAATADGGGIAQLYSYVHPGQTPRTRLVRLDPKGKVTWDLLLPGSAGPASAVGDRFDLRGDGTVAVVGRVSTAGDAAPWSVVVGPDGKVLPGVTAE